MAGAFARTACVSKNNVSLHRNRPRHSFHPGGDLTPQAWFDALPRPTRTLPQKRPVDSLPLVAAAGSSSGPAAGAAAAATVHPALSRHTGGVGGRGSRAATIDR